MFSSCTVTMLDVSCQAEVSRHETCRLPDSVTYLILEAPAASKLKVGRHAATVFLTLERFLVLLGPVCGQFLIAAAAIARQDVKSYLHTHHIRSTLPSTIGLRLWQCGISGIRARGRIFATPGLLVQQVSIVATMFSPSSNVQCATYPRSLSSSSSVNTSSSRFPDLEML
jgi:hypothetical protein